MLGVVVIGITLVFGFFLVLGLAAVGAAIWGVRQFSKRPAPAADTFRQPVQQPSRPAPAGVIEGEFVVVREPVPPPR